MTWLFLAVGAPLLFVTYQSISKLFSHDVSPFLINAYASAVGVVVMLVLFFLTATSKEIILSGKTLWLAVIVGTLVSLGNAAIIKAFMLGAPQSAFSSVFYPLLIVYALTFGFLFWHEKLTLFQIVGVVLATVGVLLITIFKNQ